MAGEPRPLSSPGRSTIRDAALSPAGPTRAAGAKTDSDIRRIGLVSLSILALIVGVVTGFGAVGFRDLIGLIHNVLFLGKWAVRYDANLFTPASPWGPFVILVPVLGGVAVTFLVNTFAPGARGYGRDLLRWWCDPPHCGGSEIAGLRNRDWQRRCRRTRGSDHPNRIGP